MQYSSVPKSARLIKCKHGLIIDPEHGPYEGKAASLYWFHLLTGNQDKHYIVVYRDNKVVLRKQATGRNVATWQEAYDDMASIIAEPAEAIRP